MRIKRSTAMKPLHGTAARRAVVSRRVCPMARIASASILACLLLAAFVAPTWAAPEGRSYVVTVKSMPSDRSAFHGEAVASANDAIRAIVVHARDAAAFEKKLSRDGNVVSFEQDLEQYRIS